MTISTIGVSAAVIGAISAAWLGLVAEADDEQRERRREVQLLGHERRGRRAQPGEEHAAVVGQVSHEVAGEAEQVAALVGAEQEQAEVDERADLVERELELGDDAEVAAATADAPRTGRVARPPTRAGLAVGGDHLGADEVVATTARRGGTASRGRRPASGRRRRCG